jgi:hypothetical protein
MKLSKILQAISEHFEISKEVLYQSFLHDANFRIFIKSALNLKTENKIICKEISEKHYLFMIDFYRNQKKVA